MSYKLADGSWSSEYKVGDRFVANDYTAFFIPDQVITLTEDDFSEYPFF